MPSTHTQNQEAAAAYPHVFACPEGHAIARAKKDTPNEIYCWQCNAAMVLQAPAGQALAE